MPVPPAATSVWLYATVTVALGRVLEVVTVRALETLRDRVLVTVCCWLVAESLAWKVRLRAETVVVGVPESRPLLDNVNPVPVSEPAASDQMMVPVPPVEVS